MATRIGYAAGMRARAAVMVLACLAGCGDDVGTSDGATDSAGESGTDPSASETGAGSASETGESTGEPGGPPGPGGARVLYLTNTGSQQDPTELFFVDCSGEVCAAPVRVHEPLAPETTIHFNVVPMTSPKRRWLVYDVGGPAGVERWLLRLDGPTMGPPRRVQMPLVPRFERPVFGGPDETVVAFRARHDDDTQSMWLCRIDDEGGCAPSQWSPLLKSNAAGGIEDAAVSPDGAWLAYVGDPEGDGIDEMLLARTGPDDAGTFAQASGPTEDGFAWSPEFAGTSAALYYAAVDLDSSTEQLFAVDLTSETPGAPVAVAPAPGATRFAFNADRSAYLRNVGDDLELVALAGTDAAPPVRLNAPEQVVGRFSRFVNHDQGVIFYVHKPDDPDRVELFLVDMAGPVPSSPVRIGEPLPMGVGIADYPVFGDHERAFYIVHDETKDIMTQWAASTPGGAAVELTASLPPTDEISAFPAIAEGHDRIAFTTDSAGFYVDLAGSMTPVLLGESVRLADGGDFSADGERLFYTRGTANGEVFMVDVSPSPGEPVLLSDPAHENGQIELIVLPPGE